MTKKQKEELGKYCLEISKLCVGSLVFNIFVEQTLEKLVLTIGGLTLAGGFLRIGMKLFKGL
jgi:hypothetical protein